MIIYIYIYIYTTHILYIQITYVLSMASSPDGSQVRSRPHILMDRPSACFGDPTISGYLEVYPKKRWRICGESVENVWRMWIIWIISRIRHIKSIQKPQKWRSPAFILHQRTILKSHKWSSDHEMASPKWAPTVWLSRSPIKIWVKHDAHRPKWLWINTY